MVGLAAGFELPENVIHIALVAHDLSRLKSYADFPARGGFSLGIITAYGSIAIPDRGYL